MAFTYFFFSNSGSVEVLGTEGWVKMIKFGFLPFVSWSLYFFSGLEYRAARTLVLLGHFFVLLQCQWHKLWLRDISRVAYPVSYLVFKYSTSGDFWVASGSLCQYFYIFICIHVVFYLFGIFGFWFFGFFLLGSTGLFPQSSVSDLNLLYGSLNPLLLILSAGNIKSRIFLSLCIKLLQIVGFHHQTSDVFFLWINSPNSLKFTV